MSKEHLLDLVKATVNGDEKAAADAFHKYIIARAPTFVSEGKTDEECEENEEEENEEEAEKMKKKHKKSDDKC